jgi:hypothetical protein
MNLKIIITYDKNKETVNTGIDFDKTLKEKILNTDFIERVMQNALTSLNERILREKNRKFNKIKKEGTMDLKVIREQGKTLRDLKRLDVFIFENEDCNKFYGCCVHLDDNGYLSLNKLEEYRISDDDQNLEVQVVKKVLNMEVKV